MGIQAFWPRADRRYSLWLVLAADKRANEGLSLAGGVAIVATSIV